jgi:hypothetical protein
MPVGMLCVGVNIAMGFVIVSLVAVKIAMGIIYMRLVRVAIVVRGVVVVSPRAWDDA